MLALVYGTRPEVIKLGIVAAELRSAGVPFVSACTGQHTTLLRGMPRTPLNAAAALNVPNDGNVSLFLQDAEKALRAFYATNRVTHVVVQGDTSSALAATRAASSRPVAHVEAGIRSHNKSDPWPEESIRVEIDRNASLHLAPTATARFHLLTENVRQQSIVVTGNPVVSALDAWGPPHTNFRLARLLVTMHRREWYLQQGAVEKFAAELDKRAAKLPVNVIWPLHPAVAQRVGTMKYVIVQPPLKYSAFTTLLGASRAVLTDSGGVTEEAVTLGVPCAVMRRVTDRPEAEEVFRAARFHQDNVSGALEWALCDEHPTSPCNVFGEPDAAARCAASIKDWLDSTP